MSVRRPVAAPSGGRRQREGMLGGKGGGEDTCVIPLAN